MSFLKRLFGGGSSEAPAAKTTASDPVDYKGFSIQATPFQEGGQYQTCGVIRKEIGGETKEYRFIRADRFTSVDDATDITLRKAKQLVDEQGERLFQ
ncbi:HlyU family transcriptional regulator [Aquamicrobium sp. LC103]|uniref:HlyU family transcriptional regulator n=1 Tax=Aquamicrobium sp. LC103 TaxID=1120658 RepID=UPI00063EA30C|nr:HlyU family transcriptional regulator [Aquamicrobium sp. LC103]TKT80326.1 hypothetical protein XW59_008275 [Aquamicrobium sp. LC103]